MEHHSQRMLLPHPSIPESIELSSTNTPTSSLQLRSHRRVPNSTTRTKAGTRKTPTKTNNTVRSNNNSSNNSIKLSFCSYISWSFISAISSSIFLAAYWAPYWIEGIYFDNIHASFGPFRRCNYPSIDPQTGRLSVITRCSRYEHFLQIPTLAWQVTTVLSTLALFLSFFVTFILFVSFCWNITSNNAILIIKLQFISVLLLIISCFVFPYGMTTPEVLNVCGPVKLPVDFGSCQVSYSIYLFICSILVSLLSILFGLFSSKILKIREHQRLQNEDFI